MAQTNYETLWKGVTKLENDGKTKDAQKAIENIVEKSRKDKNPAQTTSVPRMRAARATLIPFPPAAACED